MVCTQLRLDTLHYNKLKAKKSDTGEIVVFSIAPRLRDRTEWCANMYMYKHILHIVHRSVKITGGLFKIYKRGHALRISLRMALILILVK